MENPNNARYSRRRRLCRKSFFVIDQSPCKNDARIKSLCIRYTEKRRERRDTDEDVLSRHDNKARK